MSICQIRITLTPPYRRALLGSTISDKLSVIDKFSDDHSVMIDTFKNELLRFIYMGGIKFPAPSIITVTFDEDKGSTHNFPIISLASQYSIGAFLKHIMIHSLLDAVFESEYPQIENKGYVDKYKALPEENNYDIAVKETYRILTMVRNVITHNKSKLSFADGRLVCSYERKMRNRETPISLDISISGLEVLYSIAVMRSKLKGEVDRYHQLMIAAMYNTAVTKVVDFQDECLQSTGIPLRTICISRKVRWNRRYRVTSPEFEIQGDNIRFTKFIVSEPEQGWAGDEYLFSENGSDYIIPGEFLDDVGSIDRKDLVSWKMINKVISFG